MALRAMAKIDFDKWGAVASGLCAVHCAVVGLALGLLPVIGMEFLANPVTDIVFFATAILLGAWAARTGFKKHGSVLPTKIFVCGLFLVMFSHFVLGHLEPNGEHMHSLLGLDVPVSFAPLSAAMAIFGGLTLVTFHFFNHRLANKATCACAVCHIEERLPSDKPLKSGQPR